MWIKFAHSRRFLYAFFPSAAIISYFLFFSSSPHILKLFSWSNMCVFSLFFFFILPIELLSLTKNVCLFTLPPLVKSKPRLLFVCFFFFWQIILVFSRYNFTLSKGLDFSCFALFFHHIQSTHTRGRGCVGGA